MTAITRDLVKALRADMDAALCELTSPGSKMDLPALPNTQYWAETMNEAGWVPPFKRPHSL
jgi:hypothetical protein